MLTGVVPCAATLKVAPPPHWVFPSREVPVSEILKPLPAGKPPMTPETVELADTSRLPVLENPNGPVMV